MSFGKRQQATSMPLLAPDIALEPEPPITVLEKSEDTSLANEPSDLSDAQSEELVGIDMEERALAGDASEKNVAEKPSPLVNTEVEAAKLQVPKPSTPSSGPITTPKDDALEEAKVGIFNALIESVDLTELSKLDPETMRAEIGDIIGEIISVKNLVLSANEQNLLIGDIINDIMGLGPVSYTHLTLPTKA
mgnify:CR=1 FL=1